MLLGEADPPESLKSEQELLQKISTTLGAIGFLDRSKADGTVKILMTIQEGEI